MRAQKVLKIKTQLLKINKSFGCKKTNMENEKKEKSYEILFKFMFLTGSTFIASILGFQFCKYKRIKLNIISENENLNKNCTNKQTDAAILKAEGIKLAFKALRQATLINLLGFSTLIGGFIVYVNVKSEKKVINIHLKKYNE